MNYGNYYPSAGGGYQQPHSGYQQPQNMGNYMQAPRLSTQSQGTTMRTSFGGGQGQGGSSPSPTQSFASPQPYQQPPMQRQPGGMMKPRQRPYQRPNPNPWPSTAQQNQQSQVGF